MGGFMQYETCLAVPTWKVFGWVRIGFLRAVFCERVCRIEKQCFL